MWPTRALDVLRGALMGCAEVVPGISGGTIALIVGLYERLLASMSAAVHAALSVVRRDLGEARRWLGEIEWAMLIPLFAGMGIAVLVGASVIPPLLDEYPEGSSALFFGLIIASLVVPYRMMHRRRAWHVPIVAVFAVAAFVLTGIPEREIADPSMFVVFGAAALAICALTLPGVSGSYLLLAMGLYAPTLEAVDGRDIGYVAVFGAGAITGLAVFARVLSRLLRDHRDVTLSALLGLMVGSLRALWPWAEEDGTLLAPPDAVGDWLPIAGMGVIGVAIVAVLLLFSSRYETAAPGEPSAAASRS